MSLHRDHLDGQTLDDTLGCVLKVHEDREIVAAHYERIEPVIASAPTQVESGAVTDFGLGSVSTPGS
jgi:hypothetical protein